MKINKSYNNRAIFIGKDHVCLDFGFTGEAIIEGEKSWFISDHNSALYQVDKKDLYFDNYSYPI